MNQMFIDDEERLWVSTITEDDDNYQWWVLDDRGEVLAKFTWPGNKYKRHSYPNPIKLVKNGYMYTYGMNYETREDSLTRYEIVMTQR